MYVLSVAFRHLRTRPMSWVATGIIILIVVLYLLIISVLEGFKQHYMTKLRSIKAHLTCQVGNGVWMVEPEAWAAEVAKLQGVTGVTIGMETPTLGIFPLGDSGETSQTFGTLRGVDLDQELRCGRLKEILKPPDLAAFGEHPYSGKRLPGCIVGGAWRHLFNLSVGQHVTFNIANSEDNFRAKAFYIVGFFEGQNDYLENAAYVDRRVLTEMMGLQKVAKKFSIWVEDPDGPRLESLCEEVKATVYALLRGNSYIQEQNRLGSQRAIEDDLRVITWKEEDRNFYHAITRENQIMRFIMGFFLVFVVIIVFLIQGRLVAEKIRDIGALRALGATPLGIQACFLLQGLSIAGVGLLIGLPLAVLLVEHVNEVERVVSLYSRALGYEIKILPESSFLVNQIPTALQRFDLFLIAGLCLLAGLGGAFFPAWSASRINPVECLRHE